MLRHKIQFVDLNKTVRCDTVQDLLVSVTGIRFFLTHTKTTKKTACQHLPKQQDKVVLVSKLYGEVYCVWVCVC